MFNRKCKFIKHCNLYTKDNEICNEQSGLYYGDRGGGCYRSIDELKNKSKYWKD